MLDTDTLVKNGNYISFAQACGIGRMGKCCGIHTARKFWSHQRDQKWHDKQYKKACLGTALKAKPFGSDSQAKGLLLGNVEVEAKFCHQEVCRDPAYQEW